MPDLRFVGESFVTASPAPIVETREPGASPDLSFVYVTYGTGPIVIESLRTLRASLDPIGSTYEVIVVDNRHPRRPHRTANHLVLDTDGVRVVRPHTNLGFAGGCNLGAAHSVGRLIAFVNPDVEFATGWLQPLVDALDSGDVAIAAPVLRNPDGSIQSAGHHLWADGSTSPVIGLDPARPPDYASAACWLMRRTTFDAIEGFDESFHPAYYEDVDFALSARAFGGTSVIVDSSVVHRHGASTATTVVPDITPQRLMLLSKWPSIAIDQPAALD